MILSILSLPPRPPPTLLFACDMPPTTILIYYYAPRELDEDICRRLTLSVSEFESLVKASRLIMILYYLF